MKTLINTLPIKYSSFILLLVFGLLAGCNKNTQPIPVDKDDFETLKIAADFKFETTREVALHLDIKSENPQEPMHKFKAFIGNPEQGG